MTVNRAVVIRFCTLAGLTLAGWMTCAAARAGAQASENAKVVTLLVHGLTWDPNAPTPFWGRCVSDGRGSSHWDGMIGYLEQKGHRFGGVIRAKGNTFRLEDCLDTRGTQGNSRTAHLFVLEFSPGANGDGIAYKALELAGCLRALRNYTGCSRVRLVTYSAGGLYARAYVQSALPGLSYDHDVDRLITIACPHLGSEKAERLAKIVRVAPIHITALRPGSELIVRLNEERPLPPDVCFASIVVRGLGIGATGTRKTAKIFDGRVDQPFLAKLPLDYRMGTDQIVEVRSQNLRLAKCAALYEAGTCRPVYYVLARVKDPTPEDRLPFERTVHEVATQDAEVMSLVSRLIGDDAPFWTGMNGPERQAWIQAQARQHVRGTIEDRAHLRHRLSEVTDTRVLKLDEGRTGVDVAYFQFEGVASWRWHIPGGHKGQTRVSGTMELCFDKFGRVVECRHLIATERDLTKKERR